MELSDERKAHADDDPCAMWDPNDMDGVLGGGRCPAKRLSIFIKLDAISKF